MLSKSRLLTWGLVGLFLLAAAACQSTGSLAADAGPDQQIQVGESPLFDGCASTGAVSYTWTITEPPAARPEDLNKIIYQSECAITLDAEMLLDDVGSWVVELTVADTTGATSTDTVRYDVVE